MAESKPVNVKPENNATKAEAAGAVNNSRPIRPTLKNSTANSISRFNKIVSRRTPPPVPEVSALKRLQNILLKKPSERTLHNMQFIRNVESNNGTKYNVPGKELLLGMIHTPPPSSKTTTGGRRKTRRSKKRSKKTRRRQH